jgi:predicted RNA-binding protein with PIN domain
MRARYLVVDGHSIIFAWRDLHALHEKRPSLAREALTKELRHYQDWTGIRVAVVFDGRGPKVTAQSEPGDIQVFYSRRGQTADAVIERLAAKYAMKFELIVATSDHMECQTVMASGGECVSPRGLRELLKQRRWR